MGVPIIKHGVCFSNANEKKNATNDNAMGIIFILPNKKLKKYFICEYWQGKYKST